MNEAFVSALGLCCLGVMIGVVKTPAQVLFVMASFLLGAWLEYKKATR